jgi:hypothetical protein
MTKGVLMKYSFFVLGISEGTGYKYWINEYSMKFGNISQTY